MSAKNRFLSELTKAVASLGGAFLTREAYERTVKRFVSVLFTLGYTHFKGIQDIRARHINAYIQRRIEQKISTRTMQNEMAHLRNILRAGGGRWGQIVAKVSNKELGIGGGSRLGKKTPMTDEALKGFCDRSIRLRRPGFAALLKLERNLGLRGNEAIHADVDTLERWHRELTTTGKVDVIRGTKGGRRRTIAVQGIDHAKAAVEFALEIARKQNGYLVARKSGKPVGGLKQARSIYHSWCIRTGVVPHSARYAFALEQEAGYLAAGFGNRDAYAAVSLDLGHGPGRGRWVKSVYCRTSAATRSRGDAPNAPSPAGPIAWCKPETGFPAASTTAACPSDATRQTPCP